MAKYCVGGRQDDRGRRLAQECGFSQYKPRAEIRTQTADRGGVQGWTGSGTRRADGLRGGRPLQ